MINLMNHEKIALTFFSLSLLVACGNDKTEKKDIVVSYPKTKTVDTIDTYFGVEVKDPYRWLEDDRSAETEAWVKAENVATNTYLDQIPFREALKNRLSKLWNYEKVSAPFNEGDYTYFIKMMVYKTKVCFIVLKKGAILKRQPYF
ncbi:prolyl endopeptidase [Algibacter lectus]|uniref:Prolyl endopeptidase n=1 Tax=Algibacter lectus TaxID=221126 RepID=A0A090VZA6_9FLAO|nr:prolyl endopeptidase [Algibacter lectus]